VSTSREGPWSCHRDHGGPSTPRKGLGLSRFTGDVEEADVWRAGPESPAPSSAAGRGPHGCELGKQYSPAADRPAPAAPSRDGGACGNDSMIGDGSWPCTPSNNVTTWWTQNNGPHQMSTQLSGLGRSHPTRNHRRVTVALIKGPWVGFPTQNPRLRTRPFEHGRRRAGLRRRRPWPIMMVEGTKRSAGRQLSCSTHATRRG